MSDVVSWKRKRVPKLAHGLEGVLSRYAALCLYVRGWLIMLHRSGVHWLKDPDSGKYNFDEHLESIPKVEDFAFDRLPGFVPSSQDHVRHHFFLFADMTCILTSSYIRD